MTETVFGQNKSIYSTRSSYLTYDDESSKRELARLKDLRKISQKAALSIGFGEASSSEYDDADLDNPYALTLGFNSSPDAEKLREEYERLHPLEGLFYSQNEDKQAS